MGEPTPDPPPLTDTVIWRATLVMHMIDLLDEAVAASVSEHRWGIAPWRRTRLQQVLLELLDRSRRGWVIADVPVTLVAETRALRVEARQRSR